MPEPPPEDEASEADVLDFESAGVEAGDFESGDFESADFDSAGLASFEGVSLEEGSELSDFRAFLRESDG